MTREQVVVCPVPTCRKHVKRLEVHFRQSHPDLDPAQYGIGLVIPEAPGQDGVAPGSNLAATSASVPVAAMGASGPALSGESQDTEGLGDMGDGDQGDEGTDETAGSAGDAPNPGDPPASAPEPGPEPDPLQSTMVMLADIIKQQGAAMAQLQGQLQQQQKDFAEFQQSVVANFNSLPNIVEHSLTARLDQLSAQYQQQQASGVAGADPTGAGPAQIAQDPKGALVANLLPILLQKFLGGGEQQNGMGQLVGQLQGLGQLMNTIGEMQRTPWMQGAKFVTDVFATGARIGLSPDQTAASMTRTLGDMGGTPSKP